MSGIFGFTSKNMDAGEKNLHALDVFNRSYGHEGSDTFLSEHIGAGCHLEHFSNVFPASAPVICREQYIAVVDALLYNREELLGHIGLADTISDEELLLEWIERKGFSALASVNGDFAGAIYSREERTWTLFRDHSGVRPLFYYMDDMLFAFSSDMRGLSALPDADMRLNEEKLYTRMAGYNELTLCETEYDRIRCIRPASWTIIRETENGFEFSEHVYFTWRQKKVRLGSDREYQQELRRLITDAVQRRLDAVPGLIGCELSGGLDSSIIAILISRLGRDGHFYSWSYPPEDNPLKEGRDERKIIQDICDQENITCHYDRKDKSRTIDTVMEEMTVPYMNTHVLTKGCKYVKDQGCRVMFTGHGGDEGVSHRCNFYELWLHHEYYAFFRNLYRRTEGMNLRLLRTAKSTYNQLTEVHNHFKSPFRKTRSSSEHFIHPDFAAKMQVNFQPKLHYFAFRPYEYIMQGGHRVRLDNIAVQGAQAGVRYLAPYIDYRVLDYSLSIPRAQFHNGYTNRYIFRAAFDDIMPQSLRDMHYKDTPSMDDRSPQVDLREDFAMRKGLLLKYLDGEYWRDYLDMDAINAFELPENCTLYQYVNACYMINDLMVCCLISYLPQKTREWCAEHE